MKDLESDFMKNKILNILCSLIAPVFVLSLASCGEETHTFGELHSEVAPSFLNDGNIAYYECADCHKYFDINKKEVDSVVLPKYSSEISLKVNMAYKKDFTLVEESDTHLLWTITDIDLSRDDYILVVDKENKNTSRKYLADTSSNITNSGHVYNDVDGATITLVYTPNGLFLSISGKEELKVQFNYNSTLTEMTQSSSNMDLYEINNVRLKKDTIFNIIFLNGNYFTLGASNSNFRSYMDENNIMYLQCLTDGIYNISFNIGRRDIYIDLVEEIPHYTYYFHQFNYSGQNREMVEIEGSSEVLLEGFTLNDESYYYVLKINDKNTDESYSYGELDSDSKSLGETIDFEVTKMFKVNTYAKYDIYFNTETNEFRLVLIEEE